MIQSAIEFSVRQPDCLFFNALVTPPIGIVHAESGGLAD